MGGGVAGVTIETTRASSCPYYDIPLMYISAQFAVSCHDSTIEDAMTTHGIMSMSIT